MRVGYGSHNRSVVRPVGLIPSRAATWMRAEQRPYAKVEYETREAAARKLAPAAALRTGLSRLTLESVLHLLAGVFQA
jgi:hypothetical protein